MAVTPLSTAAHIAPRQQLPASVEGWYVAALEKHMPLETRTLITLPVCLDGALQAVSTMTPSNFACDGACEHVCPVDMCPRGASKSWPADWYLQARHYVCRRAATKQRCYAATSLQNTKLRCRN